MPTILPPSIPRVSDPEVDRALTPIREWAARVSDEIERLKLVPGWIEVPTGAFTNSWVNFDASTAATAAYWKDLFGKVYLKGVIKNGTIGNAAFILPEGYRPVRDINFGASGATTDGDQAARLIISAAGNVQPQTGVNTFFDLTCEFWTV